MDCKVGIIINESENNNNYQTSNWLELKLVATSISVVIIFLLFLLFKILDSFKILKFDEVMDLFIVSCLFIAVFSMYIGEKYLEKRNLST